MQFGVHHGLACVHASPCLAATTGRHLVICYLHAEEVNRNQHCFDPQTSEAAYPSMSVQAFMICRTKKNRCARIPCRMHHMQHTASLLLGLRCLA